MHLLRAMLATLIATLLMGLVTITASANRLSVSNRNARVVYRSLEFTEAESSFGTVRCPVTLEGSFHSGTIRKATNALIGHITRASVGAASACTGGSVTVLAETLPWHILYEGFTGTLPIIQSVRYSDVGVAVRLHIRILFEFFCLLRSEAGQPMNGEVNVEASGNTTNLTPEPNASIPLTSAGGSGCPSTTGHFEAPAGDGVITLLGNTQSIKITLI